MTVGQITTVELEVSSRLRNAVQEPSSFNTGLRSLTIISLTKLKDRRAGRLPWVKDCSARKAKQKLHCMLCLCSLTSAETNRSSNNKTGDQFVQLQTLGNTALVFPRPSRQKDSKMNLLVRAKDSSAVMVLQNRASGTRLVFAYFQAVAFSFTS
jgi:hypothetical protein